MKVHLIVPYFGKFPNYFQLVLNSMAKNPDYDWLIFTDDKFQYDYPTNVHVHYTTFEDMKKLFQSRFEFKIVLERPYQFCDFRPAYGYIFSDYLKEYDFWGHCDIDCIFGDLGKYITNDILNSYSRIYSRGHLCLYKNNEEMNHLFSIERYPEICTYRYAFSTNFPCHFDEWGGVSLIAERMDIPRYDHIDFADIRYQHHNFMLAQKQNKYIPQIFCWDKGKIIRYYIENRQIKTDEYCYIHLQKRAMEVCVDTSDKGYLIIPNQFIEDKKLITLDDLLRWSKPKRFYYTPIRAKILVDKFKNGGVKHRLLSFKRKLLNFTRKS